MSSVHLPIKIFCKRCDQKFIRYYTEHYCPKCLDYSRRKLINRRNGEELREKSRKAVEHNKQLKEAITKFHLGNRSISCLLK